MPPNAGELLLVVEDEAKPRPLGCVGTILGTPLNVRAGAPSCGCGAVNIAAGLLVPLPACEAAVPAPKLKVGLGLGGLAFLSTLVSNLNPDPVEDG